MFSPFALPLGVCKKYGNTNAEADAEDTHKICHWRDSSVAASQRATPQYTHTISPPWNKKSCWPGWWPLSYMWNCLPPYNHHTIPISVQIQDPTPQTWPQWGCWLDFTALLTTPRREHSFTQVQPASNVGTPAIPLRTQSEAGSFLRDRIFAKQYAHLPRDEGRGWKGSATELPTNPILWRHNNN